MTILALLECTRDCRSCCVHLLCVELHAVPKICSLLARWPVELEAMWRRVMAKLKIWSVN
jgi:hypothetical protein